jgi:hypothetical protein
MISVPGGREMSVRGERFNALIGQELLRAFSERKRSARSVAAAIDLHFTVLHNYTSGKRAIPVPIIIDLCDEIGEKPYTLVLRAYDKLEQELGPAKH